MTVRSITNQCYVVHICNFKSTAKKSWFRSWMYQFLSQDCSTLCKMLSRLVGLLCYISSHVLTQCILKYIKTIPKITSRIKLKGSRKRFKKECSICVVQILPAKLGFVWIFMIDWINLIYGLSLKSTKGCQALPKYGSFGDTCSALAFLQKNIKPHKFWTHPQIRTSPKSYANFEWK